MRRVRWSVLVVAMVVTLTLPGTSSSQKKGEPPPADVTCGTQEWVPFKEAVLAFCGGKKKPKHCDRVVKGFTTCHPCEFDEDIKMDAIPGADIAKGKFTYGMGCPDGQPMPQVHFAKAKTGWGVKKLSAKRNPHGGADGQ